MNGHRVLIAYNAPRREQRGRAIDYVSEAGVLEQVNAVHAALLELGYEVMLAPLQKSIPAFMDRLSRTPTDLVFNLVEGWQGESRFHVHVACLYELLGVSYTGAPPPTLMLATDKWTTKMMLHQAGLPVPAGMLCSEVPGRVNLRFPVIVKPVHEDASLGIDAESVVYSVEDLRRRVAWVIQNYHQPALVEEYIDGRELNIAILGDQIPEALPISEITFPYWPAGLPRICSYNVKWMADSEEYHAVEADCPAALEEETALRVQQIAIAAFQLLGCRDYARVDMRLSSDHQPYIVEVNPNPDISPDAGLTRSAMASGRSYVQLVGDIMACALKRGERNGRHSRPAARRSAVYQPNFA
ncbi:MAG: D-alanine--D-alanine ligase [bacterium]|nr:D-alanine--D-alanine ligase [bacterium]